MANVDNETRNKTAPDGSGSRIVPLAAAATILVLAVGWLVSAFTDANPLVPGSDRVSEPDPVIVTDPAIGTEAPLSSDTQGATRTELGSTPPDTTPD